ncbi:MAG: LrgB family protein [Paracoccaceae bacterium]
MSGEGMIERMGVFLEGQPMLGLVATLAVYAGAVGLHRTLGAPTLMPPFALATLAIGLALLAGGIEYRAYFESAEPLHWALGPVVVLLAVPLHRRLGDIRAAAGLVAMLLAFGCAVTLGVNLAVGRLFEIEPEVASSLVARSVTTPVAVGISEMLGGLPGLTALVVIATGLVGSVVAEPLFRLMRVEDDRARGFAMGVAAHALGTARAFQISETAGAFASLGMILNALATVAVLAVGVTVSG